MKRLLSAILLLVTLASPAAAGDRRNSPSCPHGPRIERRDEPKHYGFRRPQFRTNNFYFYNWDRGCYEGNRCCTCCDPCRCNPCRCNGASIFIRMGVDRADYEEVQRGDCPNGKCPRPGTQNPGIDFEQSNESDDLSAAYYRASVRLSLKGSGGSATVIDSYKNEDGKYVAILMGCYHVVDHRLDEFTATFFWPEKFTAKCGVIKTDPTNDLAIMVCEVPNKVPYIGLCREGSPPVGARVMTVGCPALPDENGKIRQSDPVGYFTNVVNTGFVTRTKSPRYMINKAATPGHSGGGVFKGGTHRGVLVTRDEKDNDSGVVTEELCVKLYEVVFCEGDSNASSDDSCFRGLFRRRQPKTPYEKPGDLPNLRPERPAPEPPPVPQQTPVIEPEPESDELNPVLVGCLLSIPAGIAVVVYMIRRKD